MNHSMPGLPVHHQLLESTQTHVHRVDDAIQPSHPLSSPSPPARNLSQHQGLFQVIHQRECKVRGFPGDSVVKNPPAKAGATGSNPDLGRPHVPRSD